MNLLSIKIGIIGGGQLGKMMILEAKKMGFYVITLDPTADCPAHSISDEHIVASFDDFSAITLLAEKSDVVTYEFEHISVNALLQLEDMGYKIYPTAKSLKIIQNKLSQKLELHHNNIPVPDFIGITSESDFFRARELFGYPFMLKTSMGGYDGKGNAVINANNAETSYRSMCSANAGASGFLMAERFVDYVMEISVLACRGIDGQTVIYPVGQNKHIDNILDETRVPADISETTTRTALETAGKVMEVFKGVGMFCVEMFVTKDGGVLVNEVAPRPHNSGHYSIEGCVTSQFEQHIRAVCGLPLGSSELLRPSVMRNILGEEGCDGKSVVTGAEDVLKIEGVKLHIYGKSITKPNRKMGHLTVTASTVEIAAERANLAKSKIKVISE